MVARARSIHSAGVFHSACPVFPAKWTYFYLYVMLDVFSRYVVGWMVAHRESATLAERFIHETCGRQGIDRGQLAVHSDQEPAMTRTPFASTRSASTRLA